MPSKKRRTSSSSGLESSPMLQRLKLSSRRSAQEIATMRCCTCGRKSVPLSCRRRANIAFATSASGSPCMPKSRRPSSTPGTVSMSNTRQFTSPSGFHHHGKRDHDSSLVAEAHVPIADAQRTAYPIAALGKDDLRLAPRVLHHAHVANPHAMCEAGAHRLDDRLLGGKTHRDEARGPAGVYKLRLLLGHEQALHEVLAETLERALDPVRFEHVDPDAENHGRAAIIRAFMVCTASVRPTNTARDTMACPILSSTISAIAATGWTLW